MNACIEEEMQNYSMEEYKEEFDSFVQEDVEMENEDLNGEIIQAWSYDGNFTS